MVIEYKGNGGKYYQAVIIPSIESSIFSEKSFNEIPEPTIVRNSVVHDIDLQNPAHAAKVIETETLVKLQNNRIGAFQSGTLEIKSDGSSTLIIVL